MKKIPWLLLSALFLAYSGAAVAASDPVQTADTMGKTPAATPAPKPKSTSSTASTSTGSTNIQPKKQENKPNPPAPAPASSGY